MTAAAASDSTIERTRHKPCTKFLSAGGGRRPMNGIRHLLVSVVVSVFVLVAVPTPAQAQWTVAAGYQALHLPDNWVKGGFNVDVARDVSGMWSVVGEFG